MLVVFASDYDFSGCGNIGQHSVCTQLAWVWAGPPAQPDGICAQELDQPRGPAAALHAGSGTFRIFASSSLELHRPYAIRIFASSGPYATSEAVTHPKGIDTSRIAAGSLGKYLTGRPLFLSVGRETVSLSPCGLLLTLRCELCEIRFIST